MKYAAVLFSVIFLIILLARVFLISNELTILLLGAMIAGTLIYSLTPREEFVNKEWLKRETAKEIRAKKRRIINAMINVLDKISIQLITLQRLLYRQAYVLE